MVLTIKRHFQIRGLDSDEQDFANIWPFLSLLHDVGYLFEGKIDPLDSSTQSDQVKIGVEVVHDYFNHEYWMVCDIDSVFDRERIRQMSGVKEPYFSSRSMSEVADVLRSLGDLEKLREAIKIERSTNTNYPTGNPDYLNTFNGLPGDSFDLWFRHYDYYNLQPMKERILFIKNAFEYQISEGVNSSGLRLLDHGVTSGLLILLYSTHYFKMLFGLGNTPPSDLNDRIAWKKFKQEIPDNVGYHAMWWWTSILWATAASAIHNIQQMELSWPKHIGKYEKISVDEDPLCYLSRHSSGFFARMG